MAITIHAGLALLALGFLMPGHYVPWVSFQSEFVAALGAALVGIAAALHARRMDRSVRLPLLALLALATAAVPWLQYAAGQIHFLSDALLPSLYLAGLALAIAAGTAWIDDDRSRMQVALLASLLAAAVISVAIAFVQWLDPGWGDIWMAKLPPGARAFANLGQPNHLATLLALGLVGVVVLFELRRLGPLSATALAAWLTAGVVMTQSRTGWLALAVLAAFSLFVPSLSGQPKRLRPTHVAVAGCLFVAAVLAWGPLNDALFVRPVSPLAERLQAGPRTLIWQAMLDAVTRAPWVGYGWNQVNLAQQAVAANGAPIGRMVDSAHNVVLDLALWGGVPLATVWVGAVVVGLWRRMVRIDTAPSWGSIAAVLMILVHALLEYPLHYTYFLLPLGLLWGLTSQRDAASVKMPVWLHGAGVAAIALATVKVGAEYLPIEQANRAARFAAAGIIDRAPSVVVPDVHWLDAPREYVRVMRTPPRPQMPADELDWMRMVVERHAFPAPLLRYAMAAGLNGRPTEAALALRRLCWMYDQRRCSDAIVAWTEAQAMHPELRSIPAPAKP